MKLSRDHSSVHSAPPEMMRHRSPGRAVLVLAALLSVLIPAAMSGCRFFPQWCGSGEPVPCFFGNELAWMSPVSIIPVCGAERNDPILMGFCDELATALRARGVQDVIVRDACKRGCEPDLCNPGVPPEVGGPDGHVMLVAVPELRPYRPMRMTVDVRVLKAAGGDEIARIVDVFEGPTETPLRESPRRFRLFREVEREETADREAYTAFLSNSPRRFLTVNAQRVTDRMLFSGPVVVAEPTAMPDEFAAEPPIPGAPELLPESVPLTEGPQVLMAP